MQILIVEDERDIRDLIALHVKREGHEVLMAESADVAETIMRTNPGLNLIILDWMLPGTTGVEFLRRLRNSKNKEIPVLMVTAKGTPEDVVQGLEAGADDYMTKPFDSQILLARVRALLRRRKIESHEHIHLGNLLVDLLAHEVRSGAEVLNLTRSEFRLLVALLNNRGRVLTRDALVSQVQGEGISVTGRTIDTHMVGVRKKLGVAGDLIETIRGVGYRVKSEGS